MTPVWFPHWYVLIVTYLRPSSRGPLPWELCQPIISPLCPANTGPQSCELEVWALWILSDPATVIRRHMDNMLSHYGGCSHARASLWARWRILASGIRMDNSVIFTAYIHPPPFFSSPHDMRLLMAHLRWNISGAVFAQFNQAFVSESGEASVASCGQKYPDITPPLIKNITRFGPTIWLSSRRIWYNGDIKYCVQWRVGHLNFLSIL